MNLSCIYVSLNNPAIRLVRLMLRRRDISCDHMDCGCVWCRHGSHRERGAADGA